MTEWQPVKEVIPPELPVVVPPPSFAAEADRPACLGAVTVGARGRKDSESLDYTGRPWMRFFARMIDLLWFGSVAGVIIVGFGLPIDLENLDSTDELILNLVILPLWLVPEALFLAVMGTTPGKALFGLFVQSASGGRAGFFALLYRAADVWIRGMGLGLPFVSLLTMLMAYLKVRDFGAAAWDEKVDSQVVRKPFSWLRLTAAIGFIVASIVILFAVVLVWMAFTGNFPEHLGPVEDPEVK